MKKSPKAITIISGAIFIILGIVIRFTSLSESIGYLLIFICRVPSFIMGLYIGLLMKNNTEFKHITTILLLGLIGLIISLMVVNPDWVYIPFALKYYAYIPLILSICLIASKIFDNIPNKNLKLLVFLGTLIVLSLMASFVVDCIYKLVMRNEFE